jgi:hypothetical protein
MRAILFAVVFWLFAGAAVAQDDSLEPPEIPPGADRIESLSAGRTAPFAGMLLDTNTAIRWTNRLRWWREAFRLQVREDLEILNATRRSHELEIVVIRDSYTCEIDGLRETARQLVLNYEQQLQRYRNLPFYEQWGFAFGLGATVVAVVGALVAGLVAGL